MPCDVAVFGPEGFLEVSASYERREAAPVLAQLGLCSKFTLFGKGSTKFEYAGRMASDALPQTWGVEPTLALREYHACTRTREFMLIA